MKFVTCEDMVKEVNRLRSLCQEMKCAFDCPYRRADHCVLDNLRPFNFPVQPTYLEIARKCFPDMRYNLFGIPKACRKDVFGTGITGCDWTKGCKECWLEAAPDYVLTKYGME